MSLDIKLPIISVKALKEIGLKVYVKHYRRYRRYENGHENCRIHIDTLPNSVADVRYALSRGGKVDVVLIDSNGVEFTGFSRCNDSDQYCKKIGVQLALTDAIRKLLISRTIK